MSEPGNLAKSLFEKVIEISSPEEREAFLIAECGANLELRKKVEGLLRSYDQAGSFLEHPVVEGVPTEMLADASDHVAANAAGSRTTPHVEDIPLDFLEPPQQPGSIGRLGQYDILETVGRGGMGIVLKAQDAKLNRVVAVKVLAPELASNPTARKRFSREAQAAAAVSHDHVVTIYAVEDGDGGEGLPYLVMEFIDGQSLQEKIDRQGQLELKEILRIGRQIASGLAAAHEQGLIHRDVKPSNVLLQNGVQRVQITDFGLARAVDDVGMTKSGEVTGTPQYMSPEQAQGQPVDARSDLFSLGSVLYAMCTGRSPFRADTSVASLRRVCDDTPRPIRQINSDIPEWLVAIIDRLLEKDADDRFQTAEEVADLLGKHLAHLQDPGSTPFPGTVRPLQRQVPARSSGQRHRWVVAGLALIVLAAGFGVTEATGVTQVTSTVFHIMTGKGTLIVEVDDPSLSVTVDRDGEQLTVSDGTHHIFTLRPGQHEILVSEDGEPVKQELVTITRGGRQVVRVSREPTESRHQRLDNANNSPVSEFNSQAITLAREGKYDAAIETLRRAIETTTVENEEQPALADAALDQLHENLAQFLNQRARELTLDPVEDRRDLQMALDLVREAIEISPENGNYRVTLGQTYFETGDYQRALEALDKGEELGVKDTLIAHTAVTRALINLDQGQRDEALRLYNHVVTITDTSHFSSWGLHGLLAEVELKLGDDFRVSRATRLYRIAAILRRNDDRTGSIEFCRRAEQLFTELIEESPDADPLKVGLIRVELTLGEMLYESGEAGKAQEHASQATALLSEIPDSQDEFTQLHQRAETLLKVEHEQSGAGSAK